MSHVVYNIEGASNAPHQGIRRRASLAVDIERHGLAFDNGEKDGAKEVSKDKEKRHQWRTPAVLQWIPTNLKYPKFKPIIRCAVAAWLALVLFIIPPVQVFFGQASFLILIASVLSPPSDPFLSVLEREVLIMLFASLSWAWSCLGIKFADLARTNRNTNAGLADVVRGQYIEAAPAVIFGVFIFLGSSFILFFRAHKGPGPYTIPCIFACVCLDISLTTAVLFPFPYYQIGHVVVLPLVFHSVVALSTSMLVFPSSISAHFTNSLSGVLAPLMITLGQHKDILATSTRDPAFSEAATLIAKTVAQADNALSPLAAASRLLRSDLIYGRYSPEDFVPFHDLARRAAVRANGMGVYFTLVDPTRPRFPATPAISVPQTPALSRQPSVDGHDGLMANQTHSASMSSHPLSPSHSHQNFHVNLTRHLHRDLLHFYPGMRRHENAVGVFESQRYMNLEATRLHDPYIEEYTAQMVVSLNDCCHDVLDECGRGLSTVNDWLAGVRVGRMKFLLNTRGTKEQWAKQLAEHEKIRDDLFTSIKSFRQEGRFRVLDLYRPSFEPNEGQPEHDLPPHRHLFQAYVYQYHLIQFVLIIIEMIDEMIRLEKERTTQRLWTPVERLFRSNNWQITDNSQHAEDEDPDTIQGMEPATNEDLGMPLRRDPDSLPPRNLFESIMGYLYFSLTGLAGGNVLFGIKAGCLTLLLSLPFMFPSSSFFAYDNRFVWAIIMGQVTIARFQGDTIFGFVSRILATFLGGVGGMVMWYISCGSGRGNAYGLAAVCAVCFPILFFARLYWPGPPMTIIVLGVTCMLVIGYSYQDVHQILPGTPGYGFSVAWRRFVLVVVGVFAAFIASFLPPATTIRRYQRSVLATTCAEIGAIYCAIVSFADHKRANDIHEINLSLSAIRAKLIRSKVVRTNAVYELSLRGPWPVERYHNLWDIQLQIAYSLSHLMSVFKHLEPAWARALLRRTRFDDTDFQGDVLSVMTMISTALRSGSALPQISPCPLLDRFMTLYHGLDIIHKESEEDYGLPRTLTLETLKDEQYLFFCVGVSTAYGLITRLDRLMVAAKEIVGEQYHIHGIGFGRTYTKEPEFGAGSGDTPGVHFRLSQET
ncbi:hypothetical protein E4T56_gene20195 [Termitomyces sp. T112]|nr:hypothetical protein E4T56_gene20195 [Termitomyces sp. T112]